MQNQTVISNNISSKISGKLRDYYILVKFRLSFIVVFSSGIGYVFSSGDIQYFVLFLLAGFFITAASNTLNQIIEKDTDKLMERTANRPLAQNRMNITEAIIAAGLMAIIGIVMMWYYFNPISALLGALSLFSYAFIYTPMKKISPIAVFIGAFPGAIPPIIGVAAATGSLNQTALILFSIQFIWQFPHFWSIAWVAFEDYARAGFFLLPNSSGRTRASAFHIVIYSVLLIPISMLPYFFGITGNISAIIVLTASILFLYQASVLYRTKETKHAKALMFGSFIYLPLVFISLYLDKI